MNIEVTPELLAQLSETERVGLLRAARLEQERIPWGYALGRLGLL